MSANTPVSKIDFESQLQRLRQRFEQQTMLGKVVHHNSLIAKQTAVKEIFTKE